MSRGQGARYVRWLRLWRATSTPTSQGLEPTSTATPCPIHEIADPHGEGCIKVTQTNTPSPITCPTDMVYDPYIHGCVPKTPTATPCPTHSLPVDGVCATVTPTPCPTGKVVDTFGGSGCGTPTPTPTSHRPYGAQVTLVNHYPRPAGSGRKKTWVFEIENVGSPYGCETHEVTLNVQLTGVDSSALISSAMLGCHETDQITVSNIVTAPTGGTVSASAHASAGAAQGNTIEVSDIVGQLGDFNCDGALDSIDAALILQIEAGMAIPFPCTGDADVNHDGQLDALDALLILQYNAGLITAFA
jgi:hypothetical protein